MNRDLVRLKHVLDSIERIMDYVADGFADNKTEDAVIRQLEIIGEAVRNISADTKNNYPDVAWDKIIGMRNLLIHEYFRVEVETVWEAVQRDIPRLKDQVIHIISQNK